MLKIKHRDIEIVIDEATVGDEMRAEIIAMRVQELIPDGERGLWNTFGDLCGHVRSQTGLPFDPLTLHEASKEEAHAAYRAYLELPKKLGVLWRKAVDQIEEAADEAIGPLAVGDDDPNALVPAGKSKSGG